jgi:hypothetical protein
MMMFVRDTINALQAKKFMARILEAEINTICQLRIFLFSRGAPRFLVLHYLIGCLRGTLLMAKELWTPISIRNPEDGDDTFSETPVQTRVTWHKVSECIFDCNFLLLGDMLR